MIELIDGLAMIADESCYTVGKPRKTADRGVVLDKPTYYTTAAQAVQGALNRAMRQAVKDGSVTTLREFIREQDRQRAEVEKLIATLDSGRARGKVVKGRQAAGMGKDTTDGPDGGNRQEESMT